MAIDVFTKRWSNMPTGHARPITGHPLTPQFGFIANNGWHELVRRTPVINSAGSGTWRASSLKGRAGVMREHTGTGDVDRVNVDALVILPMATDVTIVHAQQKTDGVARNSVAFSAEVTNNAAFTTQAYLPFSDGVAYWDWGGQVNGTNRTQVGGLTFGDDIWVFTSGPRGMEMWQNGIIRASNGSNPSKGIWGVGTENMCWGKSGFGGGSDLRFVKFTYVYWKQLPYRNIMDISFDPFCWVDPRP